MDARYNISQLVQAAFGINSPVFVPYPIKIGGNISNGGYQGIEITPEPDYGETKTSWLGTPIVFPFSIIGGQYRVFDDSGEVVLKNFPDFTFPPVTIIDFDRDKLMEETPVAGGKGSVKEIYGFTDWVMKVRVLCLDEKRGGKTAQEYKEMILQFENVVDRLQVSGALFAEKKIDTVVIKNIRIRQLAGQPSTIPIEFDMVSDYSLELSL